MSSVTEVAALKAMDGLYLRAIAIAQNVANANSTALRLKIVEFEPNLREAARGGLPRLQAFRPVIASDSQVIPGSEVRLDLEMSNASATAMRYAALADVLSRQMQINRLAARWGQ